MRRLDKLDCPQVLSENGAQWLQDWLPNKASVYRRCKYRHPDIKKTLKEETSNKCVYCESRLGVTAPGQTEHIIPSSKREELHFDWGNLTRACEECNRRKNDYYEIGNQFLNPYVDEVELLVEHQGPLIFWRDEDGSAEISLRTLGLNGDRHELVLRKAQYLNDLQLLYDRMRTAAEPLKTVLRHDLISRASVTQEYSGCALAFLRTKGIQVNDELACLA